MLHVDGSSWSNCSKKRMTSFVIGVGVDAPAVTATVSTPSSHSSFNSLKSPIRYAFVPQFLQRLVRGDWSYCFSGRRRRSSNRLFRLFRHRFLPNLGCQADFLVKFDVRVLFFYHFHNIMDIPLRHRCLVCDDQFV